MEGGLTKHLNTFENPFSQEVFVKHLTDIDSVALEL